MKTTARPTNFTRITTLTLAVVTIGTFGWLQTTPTQAQTAQNPFVQNQAQTEVLTLPTTDTQQIEVVTTQSDPTDATRTIAQDQVSITAIPPRVGDDGSLSAAPGEKLQVQLRVRNLSDETIPLVTTAQDFILDIDGETPVPISDSGSNRWSLASWLTMTPTEIQLAPKETQGINILIEIPEDALPGGHYAMVTHQPDLNGADANDSISAVSQRVGSLLYLIVEGPINEEAYVRDFSFPRFSQYGPIPFSFTVENNSDVHITPQMSVEIFDIFNRRVDTITLEGKNIFPLTAREFSGQWDTIWGTGKYTAKLTMSYGTQGSIVIANSDFWLLPLEVIIAAITILFVLILLIFAIKRHLDHRSTEQERKISELETKIQNIEGTQDRGSENDTTL